MKLPFVKDMSNVADFLAAEFIIKYIADTIPNSSTKLALRSDGYPENGEIEKIIRANQIGSKPIKTAIKALMTGCGNCQEMAYAGALILRQSGYSGYIAIGQLGLNHQFLFVGNLIVDPWAGIYCEKNAWKNRIYGYGGRVRDGLMHARLIPADSFELEDEEPEVVEEIPCFIETGLSAENFEEDTIETESSIPNTRNVYR